MSAFRERIRESAAAHGFELDPAQQRAVKSLERVHDELLALTRRQSSFFGRFTAQRHVRGLYLWGGVGRGKSFLMDSFFAAMPVEHKRRIHFHRFMQEIHKGLHERTGLADPLAAIAHDLAADARLLCLDEFHITDITDAMMMKRLLEALFEEGVVLVTTSNFRPDDLYLHGLQRNQFLPAIELIKSRLEEINVDTGVDYRLRELEKAGIYHVEDDADVALSTAFDHIAQEEGVRDAGLEIEGRTIQARREASGVVWFDFKELCDGPRGKPDYIELARRYHTVLISDVPHFGSGDADVLRRFVWLVDEFYDRRVKLMLSAIAAPEQLVLPADEGDRFQANLNASLNERLVSRLTEMQTREFLSEPHLA